jgi:hypothetical protein
MTIEPQTARVGTQSAVPSHEPANLGDILERVLDRGLVIVGDIRVSLLDIELLTVKLRLLIASVDTARELGIDWWRYDPWLNGRAERRDDESEDVPAVRSRDRAQLRDEEDKRLELTDGEVERPRRRAAQRERRDGR